MVEDNIEEIDKFELEESKSDTLDLKSTNLFKEGNELTNQIINEKDPDKLNELSQLFSMNKRKKDIARSNRLSALLEMIDDEVINRMSAQPDSFDNDQLEKYMKTTQVSINNIEDRINEQPTIQINNNTTTNVNISAGSGLSRESREKVYEAVQSILNNLHDDDDVIDVEVKLND